jgi:hypothetical protein
MQEMHNQPLSRNQNVIPAKKEKMHPAAKAAMKSFGMLHGVKKKKK